MAKKSAGILMYRVSNRLEVFLVHPGGPYFAKKDLGVWSVPKGEYAEDETPVEAAKREFLEETGTLPEGVFTALEPVTLKSGKIVQAWAVEGNLDEHAIISNTFQMEWPPRSGTYKEFPEIDRGGWFDVAAAKQKINPAQAAFIDQLVGLLAS